MYCPTWLSIWTPAAKVERFVTQARITLSPPIYSLGHFALVHQLQDVLLSTAKASGVPGRVVSLSSSAHFGPYPGKEPVKGEADIDSAAGYAAWQAYGQSKLCNVLLAR